ncbi:MAG: exoribonuclease II [Buchnera aphidicola (Nurudea yanoniella)]
MFHNHPLLSKLKTKLRSQIPRIEGVVKSTNKGFGFLEVDSHTSYFIPPKNMKKVMHGDRIIAQIKTENFRDIVYPEKLIEPFLSTFVGQIQKFKENIYIKPNFPFFKEPIFCIVSSSFPNNTQNGDWATAVLIQHKLKGDNRFLAKLVNFIIDQDNPLVPWIVTLSRHKLELSEPQYSSHDIIFNDSYKRVDLTHLNFITIDHCSTKDIDDALFIEKKSSGTFSLIVAISDPTAYITLGSSLDTSALKRGFTNYLPGFNVPMLPRILSEDKCSLKKNVRRPAIACQISFDCNGEILHEHTNFFLTWIISKSQLSYDSVSDWLEKKGTWFPESDLISNQLYLLHEFCSLRIQWRKKNALLFKARPEYIFKLSENFKILDIYIEPRRIAHKIVEEAMIAANMCAAKLLSDKLGFGIYNIHSGFERTNAKNAITFLKKYGISLTVNDIQTLEGFRRLRNILNDFSNDYLDSRIQKFLSFAEISNIPGPHLALSFPVYATWTSPIRKYSDMINHRLLKVIITGKGTLISPTHEVLNIINDRRRRIRTAERDITNWLYISFFKNIDYQGKIFNAKIIDIFRSGMKTKLLENGANVFIPSSFLHSIKHEVVCDKEKGIVYIMGKKHYTISNIIKIILIDVKIETKSIIGKPI